MTTTTPNDIKVDVAQEDLLRRVRYLVDSMRIASDARSHFGVSAASKLIPTVAIKECLETLDSYADEPDYGLLSVTPSFVRLKRAIHGSVATNLSQHVAIKTLLDYADELVSRNSATTRGPLKGYLSSHAVQMASDCSQALSKLNEDQLYISEVSAYVEDAIEGSPSNRSAFRKLQRSCHEVIALIASQGRTLNLFIDQLEKKLITSGHIPRRIKGVSNCLKLKAEKHQVAVVVDGTFSTYGLERHGFRWIKPTGRISWLEPESKDAIIPHQANSDLMRFCMRHWKIDQDSEPLAECGIESQVLILKVDAWDREQARHEALDRAEALVDLINAEHRATGYGVKRKVAVWLEGRKRVDQLSSFAPKVRLTRLLDISRSPSVDRSLRFATRAANERAGSMQTFFSWIALEYLGRGGNQKPQTVISENVPSLISIVALRQLITEALHLLLRDSGLDQLPQPIVEATKDYNSRASKIQLDRNKLGHLLISDVNNCSNLMKVCSISKESAVQAIEELEAYKKTLSEYSRLRLTTIRQILSENSKMKNYVLSIVVSADETMQRMRFVRNQTAHTASSTSTEHMLLSSAALSIMDAVFETIPKFSGRPVDGLDKARTTRIQWEQSLDSRTDSTELSFNPNLPTIV
ncbi:hypothetical protein [Glutamicibacter protophormiae]|uniref:hypothetical protein n=1 Tax=Glutamicibacter protophormiae TaxID=37930 RepID=UPI00195EAEAF|nr:hypothetical protein [Glutamicibacter protophormiae]QRQ79102.1 hypothetical protein JQN66_02265 [Glutamicibacter protophormiae]